jgi:hypothetical protein
VIFDDTVGSTITLQIDGAGVEIPANQPIPIKDISVWFITSPEAKSKANWFDDSLWLESMFTLFVDFSALHLTINVIPIQCRVKSADSSRAQLAGVGPQITKALSCILLTDILGSFPRFM